MKRIAILLSVLMLLLCASALAEEQLPYRFADAEEGAALLLSNTDYYDSLSQQDLDYRMQKKGATLEEYKTYAAAQVLPFTEEEKQILAASFARIEARLTEQGLTLPPVNEIVLIKTTMLEESGAGAYTMGNQIYLGDGILAYGFMEDEQALIGLDGIICHELFHILTRNNPDFRADMYSLIGFTVYEETLLPGEDIRPMMLHNPDVTINATATFRIGGQDVECFMANIVTAPFEQEGDMFFSTLTPVLVPVDDPNTTYTIDQAENFWTLMGQNTGYVIDPEECLADNFRFAVVFGVDGLGGLVEFPTPELLEGILSLMK